MKKDVAEAYDGIAQNVVSIAERQHSEIIHLRQFNNWIKSVLIEKYCPKDASIFDCACGKGGDIPKWKLKDPRLFVFSDISSDSLKRAYQKYQKMKKACKAYFYAGNAFSDNMLKRINEIPGNVTFDITSCQFAFHYAFKDESLARSAVNNLCNKLVPGGICILTIPNACRIVKMLRESNDNTKIGNRLFSIQRYFDIDNIPMFGAEYVFNLVESVDNCAEYLVHPQVLISLFQENKCELIETMPFHEYYHTCLTSFPTMKMLYSDLLERLGIQNAEMTPEEWEIIGLYSFFVFRKRGEKSRQKNKYEPKGNEFEIIDLETGSKSTVDISSEKNNINTIK